MKRFSLRRRLFLLIAAVTIAAVFSVQVIVIRSAEKEISEEYNAKLITDAGTGEILGAHLIGPQVTELLPELTLAHNAELTIEEIARNVHAHPSLSEVLMEAAHGLVGGYIHA